MLLSLSLFYTSCPPLVFPETISQVNHSSSALGGHRWTYNKWEAELGFQPRSERQRSFYA